MTSQAKGTSIDPTALAVAAFDTLLELQEKHPDDDYDTVCDKFYPRMHDIVAHAGGAPVIPEVPSLKKPRPVSKTRPDLASLTDAKVMQWTRYVAILVPVSLLLTCNPTESDSHSRSSSGLQM